MRGSLIAVGSALIAVACSSQNPAARMDESGLSRLNESQMEPVDDARVEEGRAHDAAARARANEADARARLEVARSERSIAEAQLKRGQCAQAATVNPGDVDHRVASAQAQEANLLKEVSQRRSNAIDLYNRWQAADTHARTLARPSTTAVPPPTSEPTPH